MSSFRKLPSLRRQVFLSLSNSIEHQLRKAYAVLHDEDGLTQVDLAERLGVDRSVVHRRLMGHTNMTVESIADMVWALGCCIDVEIYDPKTKPERNNHLAPVTFSSSPWSHSDESEVNALEIDEVLPSTNPYSAGVVR